jgi:hypothetical protein
MPHYSLTQIHTPLTRPWAPAAGPFLCVLCFVSSFALFGKENGFSPSCLGDP